MKWFYLSNQTDSSSVVSKLNERFYSAFKSLPYTKQDSEATKGNGIWVGCTDNRADSMIESIITEMGLPIKSQNT